MLYDLTSLHRDANRIMGFTAQQTLDYTQSLYEKKLVTYPRTDSRFLTEDMEAGLPDLAKKMAEKLGFTKALPVNAKQVINNKKVSDHHAIIPTQNVSDAILLKIKDFILKGAFEEGKSLPVQKPQIKEGKTSAKKHFTEDTLLSAMEHASADGMPEDAEHQGIGTPATRAGTIEKLVRIGFVECKGDRKTKYLLPTHKGIAMITVMPEQIQSASMTADWEEKLIEIEREKFESEEFMREIS